MTVAQRRARYEENPTFGDALALADFERSTGRYAEAVAHYRAAQSLDGEAAWDRDIPIRTFRAAFHGAREEVFTIEEVAALTTGILQDPRVKPKDALEIGERLSSVDVLDRVGRERVAPFLSMVHRHVAELEAEDLASRRQSFLAHYALYVEEDVAKAIRLQRASLPEGWESDAGELNGYAWWCATRRVDLAEAEVLARRAVALIEPSPMQANILDTLAEVVAARGDSTEARALIERALELDPESEYLRERQEQFRAS